jgi:hypothetical protein
MAEIEKLALEVQQVIAGKIRRRLLSEAPPVSPLAFAELSESSAAAPAVELGETFSIYNLGIKEVEEYERSGGSLRSLARATNRLHHQVRVAGKATRFAQTRVTGDDAEHWPVCELFASPLAEQIDRAIDIADDEVSDDKTAKLLVAPAFHVVALWFCKSKDAESNYDDQDTEVLVVSAPKGSEAITKQVITGADFMKWLVNSRPVTGCSFEAQ